MLSEVANTCHIITLVSSNIVTLGFQFFSLVNHFFCLFAHNVVLYQNESTYLGFERYRYWVLGDTCEYRYWAILFTVLARDTFSRYRQAPPIVQ